MVAPAKPFFSPLVVVILVVALAAGVVAILYFGGVFERLGGQRTEQTTAPTAVPPASEAGPPAAYPGPADNLLADEEMAPPPDGLTCSSPVYREREARNLPPDRNRVINRVDVTRAGAIQWNGATIDAVLLRQYMDIIPNMSPQPVTVVRVEPGAPPAAAAQVSEAISRALNCEFQAF